MPDGRSAITKHTPTFNRYEKAVQYEMKHSKLRLYIKNKRNVIGCTHQLTNDNHNPDAGYATSAALAT
jgi:hypothetical protein